MATPIQPPPVMPQRPAPMPKPEPPEEVVALGQLMTLLGQNPKYRPRILEMLRDVNPDMPIPELDVARSVTERVEAHAKTQDERNTKLETRLGELETSLRRDRWATEHGLDEEELVAVETFAKEKKVGDPESALDYYRKVQLGQPRQTGGQTTMTAESRRELYKNPRAWALREGEKVLAELRRKRGA
jgi:hypothetical protein